jgi:hypothetical protein
MVSSFTCPGVETRTYAATRMTPLPSVLASIGRPFGLQAPAQDALVGPIPALPCVRPLHRFSADSPLALHEYLRAVQLRTEDKPERMQRPYFCCVSDPPGSEASSA